MSAQRHDGHTVVVTGASSGIGREIALRFGNEGANVVVADLQSEPKRGERYAREVDTPTADVIRNETNGDAIFVITDVADHDAVASLMQTTVDTYGAIDVLVNNAGINAPGDSQELAVNEWRRVISVNLDGTFYCAKYAIPHLKEANGAIVNIASVNATEGGGGPAYASSKAGIVNLTRDLAVELGPAGVNVNAVCPGFVKTPGQDYLTDEDIRISREQTLLPRFGDPDDIAGVVSCLASDDASFIHGASITVDGGWSAHRV